MFLLISILIFLVALLILKKYNSISIHRYKSSDRAETSWACITGATDGIGLALAGEIASLGFSLILIGRSDHKLEAAAQSLRGLLRLYTKLDLYQCVEIECIVSQASDFSEKNISNTCKAIFSPSRFVSIFINNAGTSHDPGSFLDISSATVVDTININCVYPTLLLQSILRHILSEDRGSSRFLIVQTSSLTSYIPLPSLSVYSATKSYVRGLTAALYSELPPSVDICCICPSYVSTKMTQYMPRGLFCVSPKECAVATLQSISNGLLYPDIIPNFSHLILYYLRLLVAKMCPKRFQVKLFSCIKKISAFSF